MEQIIFLKTSNRYFKSQARKNAFHTIEGNIRPTKQTPKLETC